MKTGKFILILIVLVIGVGAGWLARHFWPGHSEHTAARQPLYYQSAMHPWIKSDRPGKCTICGMDLTPVYEGEAGISVSEDLVTLLPGTITVMNVKSEEARVRLLKRSLRVAGTLAENETRQRQISAYVDGRIEELMVNFTGAEVRRGEPLALIYSPQLLTIEQEYRLLAARTNIPPAFRDEHERLLAAAAQRLRQLGMTDEQIQALPEREPGFRTQILAPISGTVVQREVVEGQYVREGDNLFRIADFSKMWFVFDAYEQDLPWLQPGRMVSVTVPSAPGKVFRAPISFIDPNFDDRTRSAKVRVELDNPLIEQNGVSRRELLHRVYAEGVVEIEIPETLAVPRSAVLSPGGQPVLYVEKGPGTFHQRKVKLGRRGDDYWEVLDGVEPGELVVIAGNLLIDAQAQLNQVIHHSHTHVSGQTTEASHADLPEFNEEQRMALSEFLKAADGVSHALAADNLDEFNTRAQAVPSAARQFAGSFSADSPWRALLQPVTAASQLPRSGNLQDARKAFFPFSSAVVELTRAVRGHDEAFAAVKIYRCPMVDQSWPGAPKNGLWVQLAGPLRNPYFGDEMLECGVEVKR
jgi:membrane fusion protein, copper/silver efflux system